MNSLIAASIGSVLAWVSALSNAVSCIVVGMGVVIALGQLRAAGRQREDELKGARTQTTLDYIDQFRRARYLVVWKTDATGKPTFVEYSTYRCMEALVILRGSERSTLTSVETQCVGICTDFVISIANLLSYKLVNEELLIETFAGQVTMVDDVLALPVHAANVFMRNLRQDKDDVALITLARTQVALQENPPHASGR
jgi:hypothetical protein